VHLDYKIENGYRKRIPSKDVAYCVSNCPSENSGEECNYNSNSNDIIKANVRYNERCYTTGSFYRFFLEGVGNKAVLITGISAEYIKMKFTYSKTCLKRNLKGSRTFFCLSQVSHCKL
jgi:hypothetical protein